MNNKIPLEDRILFRDWFREELRKLDFYQRRGDHYLIREFSKYCVEQGTAIDEASLGRYLREENPVMPTPHRCRLIALVLQKTPLEVFAATGYYYKPSDHEIPTPESLALEPDDEEVDERERERDGDTGRHGAAS